MILLSPSRCKGCRICETACGFHNSQHKSFDPSKSSTRISRDNDTGVITMSINSTCDLCKSEEEPLCIKYCAYGARGVKR